MATTYGDTVNAFYLAYYGRPADPAGLAFWTAALEKSNGDFGAIANTFANSPEATARFASVSVSDRVSDIYQQLFGRAPDKAGLDFWVDAIQSGRLSVANAAIEIMHGAQTSDAQTSTLRQQVAAQFTAEVKASGIAYDGDAALQAARVLVSAVKADAKPADLDNLVKAGASLVQTAHDNPAVIKALANGGELSAVLNTSSGKADPVAVVQALASIGKAALTDSAGLNNLLQGGGMTGLLNSLPAGTSVKDVASAVSNGGLSAGAVAANPPPPPPPPVVIKPTIAYVGPDGKDLPLGTTLVANSIWYFVAIHDKPSGATVDFQVSANGIDGWKSTPEDQELADGNYFIRYVVKDSAGNSGASNALQLAVDHKIPFLNMSLVEDTGTLAYDHISSKGAVKIAGLNANETWYYSYDNKNWVKGTADAKGEATIADNGVIGTQTLVVRTLEAVNGKSQFTSTQLRYTVDKTAPGEGLKLVSVGGTAGNHTEKATGDVVFSYTGTIDASKAEALFYRINSTTWSAADSTMIDNVNKTVTFKNVDLGHGPVQIVLQTKDAAGNMVDLSTTVTGPADTTPPAAPVVALAVDSGPSATDHITNSTAVKISGLEAGASWEYSTDKGTTWKAGTAAVVNGAATLDTGLVGPQTLQVRSTDSAGNVSAVTTLEYTAQKFLSGLLSVGKPGADVTLNNAGLNPSVMLVGLSTGATKVYQMSTTGKADDFHDWHAGDSLADGTYYFRATGSDLAGNNYVTNTVTVRLDNTPPPAPTGVKLVQDTGVNGDAITTNGSFTVSGLQPGVTWQFSSDGKTWYQGPPAGVDGTATGYAQASGEQTLQVRTFDTAGNTSEPVSLHFTLDNSLTSLGLSLNGADPTSHRISTTASALDLVFSYTGTIDANDSFDYTPSFEGDATSTWVKIDSSMIDTVNKTITIKNFDLSSKDVFLTLRGSDAAGKIYYQTTVDGPFTDFFTNESMYSAAGLKVAMNVQFTAKAYLIDGGNAPVQLKTLDASGNLIGGQTAIGVQEKAVTGVLGAGNDTGHITITDKANVLALGTTGGDTLSGNLVWGFDGDDTITATGSATYKSAFISGGAGADAIHTETSSSQLMYGGSTESFLAADNAVAHGFDTVHVANAGSTKFTEVLNFEDIKFGDLYNVTAAASFSGTETGTALLAALEAAVTAPNTFKTGSSLTQAAFVSFGNDGNGHDVNFLVIDADKDGHVTSADYVVKIVGSIGSHGVGSGGGMFFIDTAILQ